MTSLHGELWNSVLAITTEGSHAIYLRGTAHFTFNVFKLAVNLINFFMEHFRYSKLCCKYVQLGDLSKAISHRVKFRPSWRLSLGLETNRGSLVTPPLLLIFLAAHMPHG